MNWHTNLIVNDQRYTFIDLAKVAADFNAELKKIALLDSRVTRKCRPSPR